MNLRDKLKNKVTENKGRLKERREKAVKEQRKGLEGAFEAAAIEGKTEYEARKDEIFEENLEYFSSEGIIINISSAKIYFSWGDK